MTRRAVSVRGDLAKIVGEKLNMAARSGRIGLIIASAWKDAVRLSHLSHRARERYTNAIVPLGTRPGAVVRDTVAKLLELGWKRFDMKPGLLRNASYKRVPIRGSGGGNIFRTVSQNSAPGSWIHPGFKGAGVVEGLKKNINKLISEALKDA